MHSVLPATIEIEISPNDRRFVFFFCRRTDKYFSRAVSSLFARVENLFHNARNDRCGGRLDATFKFKVIPIVRTNVSNVSVIFTTRFTTRKEGEEEERSTGVSIV